MTSLGTLRAEARMIAEFLKQVNDVFDTLNVRGYSGKAAATLTADNQHQLDLTVQLK